MTTRRTLWRSFLTVPFLSLLGRSTEASAQTTAEPSTGQAGQAGQAGQEMMTIFLKHDESKTLTEINQHLKQTGWYDHFPPAGVEVVSWYVMMGIGQVVTLRFPAERLREINVIVEREAWGGYRTQFYPTYDYKALYAQMQATMKQQK